MSIKDLQSINKYFPKDGILYQPGLGIIFGINAGIILGQLIFWQGSGWDKDGWTYKTEKDMRQETGLTRTRQDNGIEVLIKAGILETKLAGIPAKRHFRVDINKLKDMLPSLKETYKLVYPNPPRRITEKKQSITKNTQKKTSKITTSDNKNEFLKMKKQLLDDKNIRGYR